jgi:hypothetical protein
LGLKDSAGLCREKVEESSGFKKAEAKRFALIQKLVDDAKASKAEVWALPGVCLPGSARHSA